MDSKMERRKIQDFGYTQWKHIINGMMLVVIAVILVVYKETLPKKILGFVVNTVATISWFHVLTYIFRKKLKQTESF